MFTICTVEAADIVTDLSWRQWNHTDESLAVRATHGPPKFRRHLSTSPAHPRQAAQPTRGGGCEHPAGGRGMIGVLNLGEGPAAASVSHPLRTVMSMVTDLPASPPVVGSSWVFVQMVIAGVAFFSMLGAVVALFFSFARGLALLIAGAVMWGSAAGQLLRAEPDVSAARARPGGDVGRPSDRRRSVRLRAPRRVSDSRRSPGSWLSTLTRSRPPSRRGPLRHVARRPHRHRPGRRQRRPAASDGPAHV